MPLCSPVRTAERGNPPAFRDGKMPHTGRRPLRHFPPHGEPNRLSGLNISAAMQPVIGKKNITFVPLLSKTQNSYQMAILRVENVTKRFANHTALDDVSLEIPRGSVYGLLGPNGAGKTTLIRIINRITAPDSGKVYLDGRELAPEDVYKIGYLPEERGLYKQMKVGEQAVYFAQAQRSLPQRSDRPAEGVVQEIRHRILVGQESERTEQGHGAEAPVHRHRPARTPACSSSTNRSADSTPSTPTC